MRPASLMWLGATSSAVGFLAAAVDIGLSATALAIMGGMIFGKGYGIYEERSRRAVLQEDGDG